jgi:hypothetical protein
MISKVLSETHGRNRCDNFENLDSRFLVEMDGSEPAISHK